MRNTSAMKTTQRLKTSGAPTPAAQEPDTLTENLLLLDFMMLRSGGKIGAALLCLLLGIAEDPESIVPTIAYLEGQLS